MDEKKKASAIENFMYNIELKAEETFHEEIEIWEATKNQPVFWQGEAAMWDKITSSLRGNP